MSLIMLLLMLLAGHRLLKEKDREAGLYQKEHSIFENIRICGRRPAAEGFRKRKKKEEDSEGYNPSARRFQADGSVSTGMRTSGGRHTFLPTCQKGLLSALDVSGS